jgi:hypothetical protein
MFAAPLAAQTAGFVYGGFAEFRFGVTFRP